MANNNEEPSSSPASDCWYNITLGSSFRDHRYNGQSPKFCTLRYEFKPASIDRNQPGLLHKSKDNRVTVEFQNNQQGKLKVIFEGVGEDYRDKDNDAVLFFDGEIFRLERLHRAVKRLRHVRIPGEPSAAAASTMTTLVTPVVESHSTAVGKGSKLQPLSSGIVHQTVQVEQIDTGNSTNLEPQSEKDVECSSLPNPSTLSPFAENFEAEEHVEIVDDNDDGFETGNKGNVSEKEFCTGLDIDINLPHQVDVDEEIADVDISDDDADKGPNAAEALRAQVNAEWRKKQTSSSSSSSESESSGTESGSGSGSGSGSVSTSTDSESSYGDSVNSI
ncbi:ell-associated factor Eaf-like isoform X3 [Pistacia vera]|uniref:ell-associated factor Eaf-like isoform X3 n=1 Tax=Pistacia vera TaxID=55513 RepID=UPI00126358CC|nr:ell-associated factor Eaf-like isoform X3 [Pistacia vera]